MLHRALAPSRQRQRSTMMKWFGFPKQSNCICLPPSVLYISISILDSIYIIITRGGFKFKFKFVHVMSPCPSNGMHLTQGKTRLLPSRTASNSQVNDLKLWDSFP